MTPALALPNHRTPEPGAIVHVRQQLYLVEQVRPPPYAGDATLVIPSGFFAKPFAVSPTAFKSPLIV